MGLSKWAGWGIFIGAPIVLWLLGTVAVRCRGVGARVVAFFAGSDNRLSLSRLQAFLWTLAIFGSFAAAMAIHERIDPITTRESKDRAERAKAEAERASKAVADADVKLNEARKKVSETTGEKAGADIRATAAKSLAAASPGNADATKAAEEAIKSAGKAALELTIAQATAARAAEDTEAARKAKAAADRATAVSGNDWVKIPAELLALAGIAIGAGVFSSLIAGVRSEDKTASVSGMQVIGLSDYQTNKSGPWNSPASAPYCLVIDGQELSPGGQARIDGKVLPEQCWRADGTRIIVDLPDQLASWTKLNNASGKSKLIIDTGNGKLCYKLRGSLPDLMLGGATSYYEFADLFRDDKSPREMALMKFQMFGWTVIAIAVYSWLFLSNLHDHIETLPRVDSSVVLLTGLSQAGYLTGKAVSNVGKL